MSGQLCVSGQLSSNPSTPVLCPCCYSNLPSYHISSQFDPLMYFGLDTDDTYHNFSSLRFVHALIHVRTHMDPQTH